MSLRVSCAGGVGGCVADNLDLLLKVDTSSGCGVEERFDDLQLQGRPSLTNDVYNVIVCTEHYVMMIDLEKTMHNSVQCAL